MVEGHTEQTWHSSYVYIIGLGFTIDRYLGHLNPHAEMTREHDQRHRPKESSFPATEQPRDLPIWLSLFQELHLILYTGTGL